MKTFILEVMGGLIFLGGIWWMWPPAALIMAGILLVLVAQAINKREVGK